MGGGEGGGQLPSLLMAFLTYMLQTYCHFKRRGALGMRPFSPGLRVNKHKL